MNIHAFKERCGELSDSCLKITTSDYPLFKVNGEELQFQFNLSTIFTESMELFSVDPTMVSDNFTINLMFRDEQLDPDVLTTLMDLLSDFVEYDPIGPEGDLWMTFSDIRKWHGESFDEEMTLLFPVDYPSFKEYFEE